MPRNTGGLYSLPPGNPVQGGTTITTTWANSTLGDISTELTSSLSRDGYGGMRAPLKLPQGSAPNPALSFTADPASGLYLAGSGSDLRVTVASTDIVGWTPTTMAAFVALTAAKGLTVTNSTGNGAGVTATGNGTGAGAVLTGGATGRGATVTAGASGADALVATGTVAGYGLVATGGPSGGGGANITGGTTNGTGAFVTGTGTASGLVAQGGVTNGFGIFSTGGGAGTGIQGVGGSSGGVGVVGAGTGTSPGARFAGGTAATSGTPRNAVELTNGYLSLDGVTVPASTTAVKNAVTPGNLLNVRVNITTGATPTVAAGFNVTSVAAATTNNVLVTFAQDFANDQYTPYAATNLTSGGIPLTLSFTNILAGSVEISARRASDGAPQNLNGLGAGTIWFLASGVQ